MLQVLYEDNHLLAVAKPAGLATMGLAPDRPTLLTRAKDYIKQRYQKPGNVYLGVISRLDTPVTGVVLFARTSKAAARLTEQFRNRQVEKTYWAIVEGMVDPACGDLEDWIAHDERHRRMHVVGASFAGARQARLAYRTIKTVGSHTLVEIDLETGRKHQIRLQFATRGHAVLGDRKYGSRIAFPDGIALHARRLRVKHPVRDESLVFEAPLPRSWAAYGV
jgi:23S rRNA pseudouridine1911/1915/1917 synthase